MLWVATCSLVLTSQPVPALRFRLTASSPEAEHGIRHQYRCWCHSTSLMMSNTVPPNVSAVNALVSAPALTTQAGTEHKMCYAPQEINDSVLTYD